MTTRPPFFFWLWGDAGAGKSELLKSLDHQATAGLLTVRHDEEGTERWQEQLAKSTGLDPTAPVAAPLDDPQAREGIALVGACEIHNPFLGHKAVVQALAFEDFEAMKKAGLLKNVGDIAELCHVGCRSCFILALDPLLVDETTAALFFKSHCADLFKLYSNHPDRCELKLEQGTPSRLRAAIETSARAVLGIPSRVKGRVKGLHELTDELAGRLLRIPDDATLTWKRDKRSGQRIFTVTSEAIDSAQWADILKALDQTATVAVDDYRRNLRVVSSLMHEDGIQRIVVATRRDIADDLKLVDDFRDAVERSRQGRVRLDDVLILNHVGIKPNPDWQRVLENQDAVFIRKTKNVQPLTELIDRMTTVIQRASQCPIGKTSRTGSRRTEDHTAKGITQPAGWVLAQVVPFIVLLVVTGWMFAGGASWQWAGAGLFLLAAVSGFALLLQPRSKPSSYKSSGTHAWLTIGDQEIRREECSLWQSPLAKVFDIGKLRTPHESYLITHAQRFRDATKMSPNESRTPLALEAAQVISIAATAVMIIRGVGL